MPHAWSRKARGLEPFTSPLASGAAGVDADTDAEAVNTMQAVDTELGVDFARARGVVRTKGYLERVGGTTQKTRRRGA